jgi:hypothetical protein
MNTHATIEKQCFLRGPCRGVILTIGASSSVQLTESSARETVNIKPERVKLKLGSAAPERLLKTQQARKCLGGTVMICELWTLALEL